MVNFLFAYQFSISRTNHVAEIFLKDFKEQLENDKHEIPEDLQNLLEEVALGKWLGNSSPEEKERVSEWRKKSIKFRYALRMAQIACTEKRLKEQKTKKE